MSNPVTLDPAFVAAKKAAVRAIVEQARGLTAAQLETCVLMLRNARMATNALEHENAEASQARAAVTAVGLQSLAEDATSDMRLAIPQGLSNHHLAGMAAGHWAERAILGACLMGLPTISEHLVPRLVNPWRTVVGEPTIRA